MAENLQLPPAFTLRFPIAEQQRELLDTTLRAAASEASDYLHHEMFVGGTVKARPNTSIVLIGAGNIDERRGSLAGTDFDYNRLCNAVEEAAAIHGDRPIAVPIVRYGWWPRKRQGIPGNLFGAELHFDSDNTVRLMRQRAFISAALGKMGVGFLSLRFPEEALLLDVPATARITTANQERIAAIAVRHMGAAGITELEFGPLSIRNLNNRARRARQRRRDGRQG